MFQSLNLKKARYNLNYIIYKRVKRSSSLFFCWRSVANVSETFKTTQKTVIANNELWTKKRLFISNSSALINYGLQL